MAVTGFKIDLRAVFRWQKKKNIWKSLHNTKVKPQMSCFFWTEECAHSLGGHVTHSSELRVLPC